MNVRLSAPVALLCTLLLTHCGESSSNRCGDTTSPELECGASAACVWEGDEGAACLPKCETYEECADDEFCYPRPVLTSSTELLSTGVCFRSALTEWPQTEAEAHELVRECRARDLEDCGRNPRCWWEYAFKLNLEATCSEPMPVGCLALGATCTASMFVAENSLGELFVFAMGCGNQEYTGLNLSLDDPLNELLFEGETSVYEWPKCD